ncbi:unnamed protein product, partial [Owenia fusiformis]
MATVSHGSQSPTSLTRTLEKIFDDAQNTGRIPLSGRKLKEYPRIARKFDLIDTSSTDISKNRFTEIPEQVCEFCSMENLNCYHNVIRCIPEAIVQLQALTHLNLSRNQLSTIPPFIYKLQALEVLLAQNNKLVSLPEELGRLEKLMELDVSCNEINHLPVQIGDIESLKVLNVRKNLLVELPEELGQLRLKRLDISNNKIQKIPSSYKNIDTLEELIVENNPLTCPPAHVCSKGKEHLMKYLTIEAIKEDRRRGVMNDNEPPRHYRKPRSIYQVNSMESNGIVEPQSKNDKNRRYVSGDSGYNTTENLHEVNGDAKKWSPELWHHRESCPPGILSQAISKLSHRISETFHDGGQDAQQVETLVLQSGESVKEKRQERENELQRRISEQARESIREADLRTHGRSADGLWDNTTSVQLVRRPSSATGSGQSSGVGGSSGGGGKIVNKTSVPSSGRSTPGRTTPSLQRRVSGDLMPNMGVSDTNGDASDSSEFQSQMNLEDEFTRELNRQKAQYDAKKKQAEQLRLQQLQDETDRQRRPSYKTPEEQKVQNDEVERQRRVAYKVQEEQKALIERQREEARNKPESNSYISQNSAVAYNHVTEDFNQPRKLTSSQSFRDNRTTEANPSQQAYRRTVSDTHFQQRGGETTGISDPVLREAVPNSVPTQQTSPTAPYWNKQEGSPVGSANESSPSPRSQPPATQGSNLSTEEEFKLRHETLANQRAQEAKLIQQRVADDKVRRKQLQKDAVFDFVRKRTSTSSQQDSDDSYSYSPNNGSPSNSSYNAPSNNSSYSNPSNVNSNNSSYNGPSGSTYSAPSNSTYGDAPTSSVPSNGTYSAPSNGSYNGSSNSNYGGQSSIPHIKPRGVLNYYGSGKTAGDYENLNPNFTMRREYDYIRKELEQIEQLRKTIEGRLKVTLPDDVPGALKDGVVLCHLANHIRPRSVSSIHVPSPAVPKLTIAKCRRNVENFLDACRKIGVDQERICSSGDILEEKGISRLTVTVQSLLQ